MKKALPVLAAALLVLAVSSGTVGANALLTGKDVKNGSLTGADIKAGSLAAAVFSDAAEDALRGATGPRGNQGVAGRAGDTGASGPNGAPGAYGPIGAAGSSGSNGAAGANGPIGAAGANGAPGTTGPIGATGATGSNGAAGANGPTGASGSAGTTGPTGPTGATGSNGVAGTPGADGTVTPFAATAGPVALLTATPPTTVISLSVPAGRYVVLGKTQVMHTGAGDSVTCTLQAGATTIDQSAIKTLPALASIAVPLQAVTTVVSSPTDLTIKCDVFTAGGSADFISLIAIPTA